MDRTKICAGLALLFCVACSRPHRVIVASKNFSEQLILGEIIAQHLEKELGQPVTRKLDLGGTLLAHQAILNGQIDLYPEYTGTALTSVLKRPIAANPDTVLSTVRAGYRQWNLEWLDPLGFNNTFAMVIRKQDADDRKIATLTEAARYSEGWKLGVGYEFVQRPDGLAGLMQTYGLPVKGSVKTMDLGLLYQALEQKQVDMVAANATDGLLSVNPVVALEDDRHYFPPYQAAIVVRSGSLQEYKGLREALAKLSGRFTTPMMQKLNYQLDGTHRPIRDIAREFLEGKKK